MTSKGTKRKREEDNKEKTKKTTNSNADKYEAKIGDLYDKFPEWEDWYDEQTFDFLAPLMPGHRECPCCGCKEVQNASVCKDKKCRTKYHVSVKKCAKGCYYWPGGSKNLKKDPNLEDFLSEHHFANHVDAYFGDYLELFRALTVRTLWNRMKAKRNKLDRTIKEFEPTVDEVNKLVESLKSKVTGLK